LEYNWKVFVQTQFEGQRCKIEIPSSLENCLREEMNKAEKIMKNYKYVVA